MKILSRSKIYRLSLLTGIILATVFSYQAPAKAEVVVIESATSASTAQEIAAQELELKEKQIQYDKAKLNLQRTEALDLETARLELEIKKLKLLKARRDLMVQETQDQLNMLLEGDVLFDVNSATVKPGAEPLLGQVAMILAEYPKGKVTVTGFADSTGTPEANLALSRKRAESVKTYLLDKSGQVISTERVIAQGRGEANPVASNDNSAGRQLNRRVEITITKEITSTP